MKPIAVNWTGPERCYRSGGYSVFHKDETALLNDPKEVLFFQPWGTSRDGAWKTVCGPELGVIRPSCPDLTCGSSQSADLDGLWFECMVCGKVFRSLAFRVMMASTDAEAREIKKRHDDFSEQERVERKLDQIETKLAVKAHLTGIVEAASEVKRAARRPRKATPPPPPPAPPPRPRPPVYASLLRFCRRVAAAKAEQRSRAAFEEWKKLNQSPEAIAKRQEEERARFENDQRASEAYREWLTRNPAVRSPFTVSVNPHMPKPKSKDLEAYRKELRLKPIARAPFVLWTTLCPHSSEPRIKIISDVEVSCAACGHAFWGSFHLGIVRRGAVCPCCKGKKVVPWRADTPETP